MKYKVKPRIQEQTFNITIDKTKGCTKALT